MRLLFALLLLAPLSAQVPWRPWSPASFEEGRRTGKLVLVDAEARWCHWCHVMEARTYGDPAVARLLKEAFVAIKADIDTHPDARERYEDIGWPGTALYDPDGNLLWKHQGFLPPEELLPVLRGWVRRQREGRLEAQGVAEVEAVAEAEPPAARPAGDLAAARDLARAQMDRAFDGDHGGWGEQKYPIAMNVEACFREAHARKDAGWKLRALYTLAQQRHITDGVWGGLYQYSVGPDWHRVHFEKLTALQALYLENLAEAYRATGDADWLQDADRVLAYLRRFMGHADGGFSATQDADVAATKGRSALNGHAYYALPEQARLRHGLPRRDTQRYAREQGLMIAALCALQRARPEPRQLRDARAALAYAEGRLGEEGGFRHAEGRREAYHLPDQVAMLKGLLALHEVTGEVPLLRRAEGVAAFIEARLKEGPGRYRSRTRQGTGVFAEARIAFEDNVALARALLRLHAFTGQEAYRERALDILRHQGEGGILEAQGRWVGDFLLAASEALEPAPHLAVVGPVQATPALHAAALRLWRPGTVVIRHDPAAGEPLNPELGFQILGSPAAYLCGGGRCSKPFLNPEALAEGAR